MRFFVFCLGILASVSHADDRMPYIEISPPYQETVQSLMTRFADAPAVAVVSVSEQRLHLYEGGEFVATYPVSTSKYGIGSLKGSERTPLGLHRIRRRIGEDAPPGRIFKSRSDTGEDAQIVTEPRVTEFDYVTTRILWLDGMELGANKGGGVDSFERYIYIHGTHEEGLIGKPASHGCVRMRNRDVIDVFNRMPVDSLVLIVE